MVRAGRSRSAAGLLLALVLLALAPAAQAAPAAVVHPVGGASVLPDHALADLPGRRATRIAGPNRYATAVAVSRHAHPEGAGTVYLATGLTPADALAGVTGVVANDAALLLSRPDRLPPRVAHELARLRPDRVFALGGPTALSDRVLDAVAEVAGRRPMRLAGADRFATAAAVSRHAFPEADAPVVYLANGLGFADALSAAQAVAAHDGVLLLSPPGALPGVVARELRRLQPVRVFVLGSEAGLRDRVLDDVEAVTGRRPARLAGPDRYATAAAVARHAHPDGAPLAYAVTGRDFPDALAASQAVAARDAGLLLVDPTLRWTPDVTAAVTFARDRAGSVSFAAIGTDGRLVGHRAATRVPMASTLKVMFLAAYLRQPDVRDRDLTAADRALLEPMIRTSENAPATRIANALGPGTLYALAADAGMRDFSYTRPWGLARTSARDQARFMLDLDRFLPDRHEEYALRLLTEIVPSQRWGVGQVPTPGWTLRFKGGWGAGTGATDHQVVQLEHADGARVALAVMTTTSPDHDYGKKTLRGVFERLLVDLP